MEKTTRYLVIYGTARIVTRIVVVGSGIQTTVKAAKWVSRVAKAHKLADKSPEAITENVFDCLSEID